MQKAFSLLIALFSLGCGGSQKPPEPVVQSTPVPNQIQPSPDAVATALRGEPIFSSAIRSVAFHPLRDEFVAGDGAGNLSRFEPESGFFAGKHQLHENWTFDLAFSPDGNKLATAGGDNLIQLWDASNWKLLKSFSGHTDDVHGAEFFAEGKSLISASDDQSVRVWDVESGKSKMLGEHDAQVTAVAVSPDGRWAATAGRDETIRIWDLKSLSLAKVLRGHNEDVLDVAFSHDGKLLASASYDKTVKVWSTVDWSFVRTLADHAGWVFAVAFSPDDKAIYTGAGDHRLRVFKTEDGSKLAEKDLGSDISDLDVSRSGLVGIGLVSRQIAFYEPNSQSLRLIPDSLPPLLKIDEILSAEEYLKLHQLLISEPVPEGWSSNVARLSEVGDGFTLVLIDQMDFAERPAPQRELIQRIKQKLSGKFLSAQPTIREHEVEVMLDRAATAEVTSKELKNTLTPWMTVELKEQLRSNPAFKAKLEQFQSSLAAEKPTDPSIRDRHAWLSVYLEKILSAPVAEPEEAKR